jgi:hypothetical protein
LGRLGVFSNACSIHVGVVSYQKRRLTEGIDMVAQTTGLVADPQGDTIPVAAPGRHGTKWCRYHFRHSFATRMLEAATDALTVSALLGRADGAMLAKVYNHLSKNDASLRDAVKAADSANEVSRRAPLKRS